MDWIVLTQQQAEVAAFRYEECDNSPVRAARRYRTIGDTVSLGTCRAIRRMERRFAINLGTVCFKFLENDRASTPPAQRQVMEYVAAWRPLADGDRDLVISVDRVLEIDRLARDTPRWAVSRGS